MSGVTIQTAVSHPKIGIFGGTFDPVHLGHLIVATELRHALALDRLLFVPAGRPPHKSALDIAADDHRLAMLRLAVADTPELEVSGADLGRAGLAYTAELLERLATALGPARLFFLIGNDSLRDLPNWREPNRIAEMAELGVAARMGAPVDLDAVLAAVPAARDRVHLIATPLIGIASREIRSRLAIGAPIRFQVPPAVEAYIREHGLYR